MQNFNDELVCHVGDIKSVVFRVQRGTARKVARIAFHSEPEAIEVSEVTGRAVLEAIENAPTAETPPTLEMQLQQQALLITQTNNQMGAMLTHTIEALTKVATARYTNV
jgi:hypothetical protein